MNKFKHALVLGVLVAVVALPSMGQVAQKRASPHEASYTRVGDKLVSVYYGRPYVKGRKIWGELVPWDKAWRLGADESTTLITQGPITIGGAAVPAGAYTLYMIPSESGTSKLAISKTIGEWGEPGDENHDLARVDLKKSDTAQPVDELTIIFDKDSSGGTVLKIAWDKSLYSVDVGPAK